MRFAGVYALRATLQRGLNDPDLQAGIAYRDPVQSCAKRMDDCAKPR
jgi:hypothetical protein